MKVALRPRPSIPSIELAKNIAQTALDQKGLDVALINLSGLASYTDYIIVISGTSDRHVQGIADKIERNSREFGEYPSSKTGIEASEWVVMDYGDVVVHIFYEPLRSLYGIDRMWEHAPRIGLSAEYEVVRKSLRTGMFACLEGS
ncbi:ribosome silencing factor [bacterium]|nr:ribosome silencing factor [bacterium]